MAKVCVITGGGSGMGLEAAKFMAKDKIIVISGRTMSKLENGVKELNDKKVIHTVVENTTESNKKSAKKSSAKTEKLQKIG